MCNCEEFRASDGDAPFDLRQNSTSAAATAQHYSTLPATSYEQYSVFSPNFIGGERPKWAIDGIIGRLKLKDPNAVLCDLGGGTGLFSQLLKERAGNPDNIEWVVVDPYASVVESKRSRPDLRAFQCTAVELARMCNRAEHPFFNRVLIKEAVHHLEDRPYVFKGLHSALKRCGSADAILSIFTRPKYNIDLPLWPDALDYWASNQPYAEDLAVELKNAGFQVVTIEDELIPCRVTMDDWHRFVMQRCWSTFSAYTDDELRRGLDQIASTRATGTSADPSSSRIISFTDRIVHVTAHVTQDSPEP